MKSKNAERDIQIWEARNTGLTYQQLSDQYHISRERCQQICTRLSFRLATNEIRSMLAENQDVPVIAEHIKKKYHIDVSENLVRSIAMAQKRGKKTFNPKRVCCFECQFGREVSHSTAVLCNHPSREEPLLYRGKNRPHDCPLRRGL